MSHSVHSVHSANPNEYWHEENLPNDALVLFRNLAGDKPINVKALYDDLQQERKDNLEKEKALRREKAKQKDSDKGKGKGKDKEKVKSKKTLIIEKNINDKLERNLKEDRTRIKSFAEENSLDFERWLSYQLTDQGRNELKLTALRKTVKNKEKVTLLELALQLEESMFPLKQDQEFLGKVKKQINNLPTKELQLELLGNRLPPLDFYNQISFRLDNWQIEVLEYIKNDISVLVTAPTSSGKTVLSTYFATIGQTVLYIVPSKPLAFQVASIFHTIAGEGIAIFVDDFSYYPQKDIRVVVGTPYEIENKFPSLPDLDIAVFDEVHNINSQCGECYERIIKWHRGNFLALSATIKNADVMLEWLQSLSQERQVKLVEYRKRFINIQRHLWNDGTQKLEKLHPLACLELSDFQDAIPSLAFTPWDCISIWKSLVKLLPKESLNLELSPEVFFRDITRISLDNSKDYEMALKNYLSYQLDKAQLQLLLDKHQNTEATPTSKFGILKLFMSLKHQNLFPSIAFNINTVVCQELFTKIVKGLEAEELVYYPFHYENLEHRYGLYQQYQDKREKLISETKEGDKIAKLMRFDKTELSQYQKDITERYERNIETLRSRASDPAVLQAQLRNLKQEYNSVMETEIIQETDLFEKCPEYCFTLDPMKADRIRQIKKKISRKMNMKLDYNNVMLQGLKRGIGIYTKDLPDVYLRIVQELAQNKELGVVISDESLALGINMPFRSSVMCGWEGENRLSSLLFQQMSGRAGRRGLDCEGHVIFANVHWRQIMKGEMEELRGNLNIPKCYDILANLNPDRRDKIGLINSHYLSNFTRSDSSSSCVTTSSLDGLPLVKCESPQYTEVASKTIWKLRKYHTGAIRMAQKLDDFELWLKVTNPSKTDIIRLFKYLMIAIFSDLPLPSNIREVDGLDLSGLQQTHQDLLVILERNKLDEYINDQDKHLYLSLMIEVANIVKSLHNIVAGYHYFKVTKQLFGMAFAHCKQIIYNYHKLNNH